ncbi:MAG: GAF domain-containing protein [Firmicutes bacterium]|nr:GAF domain-containing protein [Bacillota bacterium]MCL5972261.1 GAF domain-containing protein [Bacillota bacterium]
MEIENSWKEDLTSEDVLQFADGILSGESNCIANLSNLAALLGQALTGINWVGFYLREDSTQDLVLGPFAGRPACTRITPPKGVIGQAVQMATTLVVDNVLDFPGHIACDAESRSEIVVPVIVKRKITLVIDVDSPEYGRFGSHDQMLLEMLADKIAQAWPSMTWYQ